MKVLHPIVTGPVIAELKAGLAGRAEAYTDNVTVARKRPHPDTARMVTVSDRGGPSESVQSRRLLGFNVWAETSETAEQLALMVAGLLTAMPDGDPITAVDGLSTPAEVPDAESDIRTVSGETLAHYFFTARVTARGIDL